MRPIVEPEDRLRVPYSPENVFPRLEGSGPVKASPATIEGSPCAANLRWPPVRPSCAAIPVIELLPFPDLSVAYKCYHCYT